MIVRITKRIVARVNRVVNPPKRQKLAGQIAREVRRYRLLTGHRHESHDTIVLRALKQQNDIVSSGVQILKR